ncbi:MAG: FtsX-like permease family protein [Muribaculaceae bacterium]|nr:FtsX-like permease family protein [Muribaculaceae bacterium]
MNYFRQIYYEMKHQRMMTWVSISGTALAIFLVMAFVMVDQLNSVEVAPESNRSRILIASGFHVKNQKGMDSSTSGLNLDIARRLYENLEGVEVLSYINAFNDNCDVNLPGQEIFTMAPKNVDNEFWKIYDFTFIDGRPFDEAEVKSDAKLVVRTKSAARSLFGEEKVAGREIEVDAYPYRVVGVVEDVNPLLASSFANFYKLCNIAGIKNDDPYFGSANVVMLLKEGVSAESVKTQVENRYKMIQSEFSKEGYEAVYHGQPYTSEEVGIGGYGSNNGPDLDSHNKIQWIIYSILILLPAINLSSMTRGRLRHRVAEIGVRRAFGAKRNSIIRQIFGENLIITFFGGMLGLLFSIIFVWLASNMIFSMTGALEPSLETVNARPDLGMLFRWGNFLWALLFCFILNVLSATVPAWRASKVEPAEALSFAR